LQPSSPFVSVIKSSLEHSERKRKKFTMSLKKLYIAYKLAKKLKKQKAKMDAKKEEWGIGEKAAEVKE
jgi:hypothetical protein